MNSEHKKILVVLLIGVLMSALDISIIGPVLPKLQEIFSINTKSAAWLINIFVLFNIIGSPILSSLSDKFSRKNIYILSILIFSFGSLIIAFSPSYEIILFGRAIQGIGAGGIFPIASSIIGDIFPEEHRGKALGLMGASFGIAFLIGPIIGGVLLKINWQFIFLINIPIAIWLIYKVRKIFPDNKNIEKGKVDVLGLTILVTILLSLSLCFNYINAENIIESFNNSRVISLGLIGLILIPVFVFVESKKENPLIKISLFSKKQIMLTNIIGFIAGAIETGTIFLPSLAIVLFDLTPSNASFMLIPLVLALTIGAPIGGRSLDKHGGKKVLSFGTAVLSIGMFIIFYIKLNYFFYFLGTIFIGFGMSFLSGAPLRYIMLSETDDNNRGFAQALIANFSSMGRLFSSILVGVIIFSSSEKITGFKSAFLLLFVLSIVSFILALLLNGKTKKIA